ncbi:MAG TPA: ATP-binding cassette domain-containing protein [Mycobacteriales bacterium]|nr:ATP-binding cassette domain-containing protein [Mycobacteriales bacterium]
MPVPALFSRYLLHVQLLWRAAPRLSMLCALLEAVSAGAATVSLIASGHLIGSLPAAIRGGPGSAAAAHTWHWLIVTVLVLLVGPLASAIAGGAEEVVSSRYLGRYYDLALDTAIRPYGVAHLEDQATAHRMAEITGATRDWLFLAGLGGTWRFFSARLAGIGAVVVVAQWCWWVPLISIAAWSALSRAVTRWNSARFDELIEVTGTDRRRANYLRLLLSGRASAKELRLFGLLDWLRDTYVGTWERTMAAVSRNRANAVRSTIGPMSLVLAVTAGAFALLARDSATGRVGTAALVTVVQGVLALSAFGPRGDAQASLARVTATLAQLASYRRDLGLPFLPPEPGGETEPRNESQPAGVALRGVSFAYPASDRDILANLDLDIPAGQSIAIVGVNGAGKSTLIKLLCGLYPVRTGTLRVAGRDPATDPAARRRIAVIFQEFLRYPLSLRANVEAGAGWRPVETLEAIGRDTGIVAEPWDRILSAEFDGGTDLSGGQWQRVALARAFAAVSVGAGLLILDEPTAALDVRAEAELFEKLLRLSRGITTILVSHRLSSVRHADRIVVIDGGRVIEDGTHTELLARGGEYAHMFRLQAARFELAKGGAR